MCSVLFLNVLNVVSPPSSMHNLHLNTDLPLLLERFCNCRFSNSVSIHSFKFSTSLIFSEKTSVFSTLILKNPSLSENFAGQSIIPHLPIHSSKMSFRKSLKFIPYWGREHSILLPHHFFYWLEVFK